MAGRRLREHFAAAVLCYASEERKRDGGGDGTYERTKPSLRLYRSCPRPAPPTMKIPESASPAVDPSSHDAVGLCYLSTGCRIARTIKLSGEQGVRGAETRNVTVNRQKRPNNEVAFLARAIGSLVDPLRTVEIIKIRVSGIKTVRLNRLRNNVDKRRFIKWNIGSSLFAWKLNLILPQNYKDFILYSVMSI